MANLSPAAQLKVNALGQFLEKVHRVHGLVEQYAAERGNAAALEMPIRRAFEQLKLQLMGAGMDALSQLAGSMAMAMRRGGSQQNRTRILREGVGSMRFQIELEQRSIISEDQAQQEAAGAPSAPPDA